MFLTGRVCVPAISSLTGHIGFRVLGLEVRECTCRFKTYLSLSRWSLISVGMHNRSESPTSTNSWSYTVTVAAGAVSVATATSVEAYISTSYTANLSVALTSGQALSLPVMGSFEGQTTSPAVRSCALSCIAKAR